MSRTRKNLRGHPHRLQTPSLPGMGEDHAEDTFLVVPTVQLACERVKRDVDATECDWCGVGIGVGERLYHATTHGTCYCSRTCARDDATVRGYGEILPGLVRGQELETV